MYFCFCLLLKQLTPRGYRKSIKKKKLRVEGKNASLKNKINTERWTLKWLYFREPLNAF